MTFNFGAGAINRQIQVPVIRQSGNDNYPMLARLAKRSIGQGAIKWNADVGGASITGEAVTAAGTAASDYDAVLPAELGIGASRFRHTFSVLTTQLAEAQNNGEGELANLLAYAAQAGMRRILRGVATNLYTGSGNAASGGVIGLSGLHTAVTTGLATNAYAGINPAASPRWSTYVNTAEDARALTVPLLETMSEQIISGATLGVNSNYSAIYTTPAIATKYKQLFPGVSVLTAVDSLGRKDVGYTELSFEGRPIFADPYAPAGTMYFVDEDELALYSYAEDGNAYGSEVEDNSLTFKVVELARTNPDAMDFAIVLKAQLQVARRAAVAVLGNLQ